MNTLQVQNLLRMKPIESANRNIALPSNSFANVLTEKYFNHLQLQKTKSFSCAKISAKTVSDTKTSVTKSYAEVGGRLFNDAEFAEEIKFFEGANIQIDKKINWGATGEHQLTEEEINFLKEKYDITNLTPQEFYNLMSDLTNLNAISADDVVYKYHYISEIPFPSGADVTVITFTRDIAKASYDGFREQPVTNYIKMLLDGRKYFSDGHDFVQTSQFRKDNAYIFERYPNLFADVEAQFRKCYEINEKLISIFSRLVREDSPWAGIETGMPLNESTAQRQILDEANMLRMKLTNQTVSTLSWETAFSELYGKYLLPQKYWNDSLQYFLKLLQKEEHVNPETLSP